MSINIRLSSGFSKAFDKSTLTIGSDQSCDVVLNSANGVQPLHARLRKIGNRWLMESAGAWPYDLSDPSKATKQWIVPDNKIGIGSNEVATVSFVETPVDVKAIPPPINPSHLSAIRPPIPAADVQPADEPASSLPEPQPTFLQRAKAGATDLAQTAKGAAQLTAKQAERTKIAQLNLPSVYAELGKHLHASGSMRAAFDALHENVDKLVGDIRSIEAHTLGQPKPQGMTEKAKAAASSVKDAATIKALQLKRRTAYADLGKAAFDQNGEQAGPAELTKPIRQCLNRLSALDADIARLSVATPGKRITPKRMAIAAGAVLVLALIGSFAKQQERTAPPANFADSSESRVDSPPATDTFSTSTETSATPHRPPEQQPIDLTTEQYNAGKEIEKLRGEVFVAVGADCRYVSKVSFHNCGVTGPDLKWISSLPSVQELQLTTCYALSDITYVKGLQDLKALRIEVTPLAEGTLHNLSELTKLRTLTLPNSISNADLAQIAGLTKLQYLKLQGCGKLTDDAFAHLHALTELRILILEDTNFSDNGLLHLRGLTNLETLNISRTKVTAMGIAHLTSLKNLKALDLSSIDITDEGLRPLADITGLAKLKLSHGPARRTSRPAVTDAGIIWIQQRLPNLKICKDNEILLASKPPEGLYHTRMRDVQTEAMRRESQERSEAKLRRLADERKKNQQNRVVASRLTKKEFVSKLKQTMDRGRLDEMVTYAIYENYSFQDVFGEPDQNVAAVDLKRFYTYRCADGFVQLTVLVAGSQVFVEGVNQF